MQEIWKDIRDYEGLYQVSNLGRVKSLGRWVNYKNKGKKWQEGKILKLSVNKGGYLLIYLHKNGYKKGYSVHRLVAQEFIPNPNNLQQVNHKDENKHNNCVQNLEWCTVKYNVNYGTRNERMAEKKSKQVLQIDIKTGEIIKEFTSTMEVQRQLGINNSHISMCCKGNLKSAYGFKWRYN